MSLLKSFIRNWMKKGARRLSTQYRQATWRERALPDFIIIGAQKSGTSSLFFYLSQHPLLIPSDVKEVHFFDGGRISGVDQYENGLTSYYAHFPLRSSMANGQQTFEASPSYIFHPLVPERIYKLIPKIKLIALLRNPTDRAISHYLHEKRKGREPLPILEAFEQEETRLKPIWENGNFRDRKFTTYSYKSRGLYKCQMERYLKYFAKEQILIIPSERFFADPLQYLQKTFDFLGVDSNYKVLDLQPKNIANNRIKVDQTVYDYLNGFFRPYNEALYELLGEDFGW